MIWPEYDPKRALHNLSETLRVLTRDIGRDPIDRPPLRLVATDRLRADTREFEEAVAQGRFEDADALYSGPFLDTVHLQDLPRQFDEWVETKRYALDGLYRDAQRIHLSRLAASSEGDAALAAAWCWALADPLEDEPNHQLIERLAERGMRIRAIHHYETYCRRLEAAELDAEPREDTKALVQALREGHGSVPVNGEDEFREASVLRADQGVAVLPLLDLSQDRSKAYFCEGVAEEIISVLGTAEGLRVTPRTTAFALSEAGVKVGEVAQRLGVTHLVEGSAKFKGSRYRVTVCLLDTRLETPVWQDQFNGSLETSDAFELDENVATCVLDALRTRVPSAVPPQEKPRSEEKPPPPSGRRSVTLEPQTDPAAYVAYLKGRHAWFGRTVHGLQGALETFGECVRLDPRYARAHAAISDAYNLLGAFDYGVMPPDEAYPKVLEAARTSLELDPDLAQGHAALGNALMSYEQDFAGAEEAFRTAIELESTYSPARQWYSTLLVIDGREDEALSQAALALELDPWAPFLAGNLARIYRFLGEPERAAEQFRHSIEISKEQFLPAFLGLALCEVQCGQPLEGLAVLDEVRSRVGDQMFMLEALRGHALARAGRLEDARRVAVALKKARLRHYVPDEYLAIVYLGTEEYGRAIECLLRAKEARSQAIMLLGVEPLVAPLRGEPGFAALLD